MLEKLCGASCAVLVAAIGLTYTAGCHGNDPPDSARGGAGTGQVAFVVRSPAAGTFPASCFSEATVTIDGVDLQRSGTSGGFTTVPGTGQVVNLLDLAAGASTTATVVTVPAGTFQQLRLVMGSPNAGVVTSSDSTFTQSFFAPGGEVTVAASPEIVVVPGQTTTVFLDFDLARSFTLVTPTATCDDLRVNDAVVFTPVVSAATDATPGTIIGVVTDASSGDGIAGVNVDAVSGLGAGQSATAVTSDGAGGAQMGSFTLTVPPGDWLLTFTAPGRVSQTASVSVAPGTTVSSDIPLAEEP